MNRKETLQKKAKELEKALSRWVKKHALLQAGERLCVELRICTDDLVESTVHLPEGVIRVSNKDALQTSIHDLGLTGRPLNVLINNGCSTVADFLKDKKYEQFGRWRNGGHVSYQEIQDAFQKIGIALPWCPFLRRNLNTISQQEDARVKPANPQEIDWQSILLVKWEDYQRTTIAWFHAHHNTPTKAGEVLQFIGMGKMYAFTTINDKFRYWKLPYRLCIVSWPPTTPQWRKSCRCHPEAMICIGKLPD